MKLWAAIAALAGVLAARSVSAAPTCMSVAKFNDEATTKGLIAKSGTLTFKIKGVDPNAGKGALGSLVDTRVKDAMGTPCVGTYFKVYGPGVDLGRVKDELYNVCCKSCDTCTTERGGAVGCETWAGEARSKVIFTAPTQTCDIEIRFGGTPNQHSYAVTCDDGAGDTGVGDNLYLLEVNHITLLQGYGGVGKIAGATVLSEQFCFEAASVAPPPTDAGVDAAPPATMSMNVPVAEDVTASTVAPSMVYPDVNDLSAGDDSEFFLKFIIPTSVGPASVGTVKRATLHLTNAGTTSAEGDGGALFRVASNAWSETTLTWNTKPARGERIGRVGPVSLNQKVSLDVTSAITGPGTYSFVFAGEAADRNGTHFASKEASLANAPTLAIEYGPPPPPVTSDAGVTDSATGSNKGDSNHASPPAPEAGEDFEGSCAMGRSSPSPWLSLLLLALLARRR